MLLQITPKIAFKYLGIIIICLLFFHIAYIYFGIYLQNEIIKKFLGIFYFEKEQSIPTLYSSVALIVCSLLLFLIAKKHKSEKANYFLWGFLSFTFLFLSMDEAISIHEKLTIPVRNLLQIDSGYLFFAWVIPYSIVLIIFISSYLKFLIKLPKKVSVLFIIAGGIFTIGALGLELFEGQRVAEYGFNDLRFVMIATCEELMEMVGIAIFIYALIYYISVQFESFTLKMG